MKSEAVRRTLAACDLLIDGPYVETLPEHRRRWVGSSNQVVHFLSQRYSPEDARFLEANTMELRVSPDGSLLVNGHPAASSRLLHEQKS